MYNMYARHIRRILETKGNLCKILEIENIIYYNKYTKIFDYDHIVIFI